MAQGRRFSLITFVRSLWRGWRMKHAVEPMTYSGGWLPIIRESFAGAWQRNVVVSTETVLTFSTVYACITLIAGDIAKMRVRLMQETSDGLSSEVESPAFSPVLRRPNTYQDRIKFYTWWILSKLIHGNAYALKERDDRGVVIGLYLLDPQRVKVLVAPDGSVFYRVDPDYLSGVVSDDPVVPASEIIHDLMYPLYHPLVGVSPISACGLAALQGLKIQQTSADFFANDSNPGGILTAPGPISPDNKRAIEDHWNANYAGPNNVGKIAVLGDGLKFEKMAITAHDAQLIDQLKWTGESVCACFHVPPYMVGVGPPPNYNNIEALNQQYYSQCLQILIESLELCLDEGLALPKQYSTEFDLDGLLRMDSATKMKAATDGVKGGVYAPNEARRMFNLKRLKGGDTVYLQQQDYSLAALDARDRAAPAPHSSAQTTNPPQPTPDPDPDETKSPSPSEDEWLERYRQEIKRLGPYLKAA